MLPNLLLLCIIHTHLHSEFTVFAYTILKMSRRKKKMARLLARRIVSLALILAMTVLWLLMVTYVAEAEGNTRTEAELRNTALMDGNALLSNDISTLTTQLTIANSGNISLKGGSVFAKGEGGGTGSGGGYSSVSGGISSMLPPPEVRTEAGESKIYLLWTNTGAGGADGYQIRYYQTNNPDDFKTREIRLGDADFFSYIIGTETIHFCYIFGVTNNIEYTFEVRAVDDDTNTMSDVTYTIGKPIPMGNPGGYEADLISVQGINVMPVGGWPAEHGNQRTDPYNVTIALPCTYLYFILHRNSVSVALGTAFTMYRDPGFQEEVVLYDRLDGILWLDEIYMFIKVTSTNGFTTKFYQITIEQDV
jgi:hypothetical protein